jgi:hypothetical protein
LEKLKEWDEELNQTIGEYLENFDLSKEVVPISFPLNVNSEDELDDIMSFLLDLQKTSDLKAYSVVTEITLEMEDEDEEDVWGNPAIFSEDREGNCFLTVFDWEANEIDDLSGAFEKDNLDIENLRLPFFK